MQLAPSDQVRPFVGAPVAGALIARDEWVLMTESNEDLWRVREDFGETGESEPECQHVNLTASAREEADDRDGRCKAGGIDRFQAEDVAPLL